MDGKGVTYLDNLCHKLYDEPKGTGYRVLDNCRICGWPLETYYCEERLYLVRCPMCGTLALVTAKNPVEAAHKTIGVVGSKNDLLARAEAAEADNERLRR